MQTSPRHQGKPSLVRAPKTPEPSSRASPTNRRTGPLWLPSLNSKIISTSKCLTPSRASDTHELCRCILQVVAAKVKYDSTPYPWYDESTQELVNRAEKSMNQLRDRIVVSVSLRIELIISRLTRIDRGGCDLPEHRRACTVDSINSSSRSTSQSQTSYIMYFFR